MRAIYASKWWLSEACLVILTFTIVGCDTTPSNTPSPSQSVITPTTPFSPGPTSTINKLQSANVKANISLSNPNVKSGDTFAADVIIDSNISLRGAQCVLSFDPVLMKCDRVAEGDFFKSWAAANGASTIMLPQPSIDNVTGNVTDTGIAIMGSKKGGVKGSGVFCTYYFTALADGVARPVLSNIRCSDETGIVFPLADTGN